MADNAALVARYIEIRDLKAKVKAEADEKIAKLDDALDKLERHFLSHLNETKSDSVGTASGTFFKSKVTSATVADWDQLLTFVRENGLWHMLDKRVNKTATIEYMDANTDPETGEKQLPPGVNYREETVVRVRAA